MNVARYILRRAGWTVNVTVPDFDKCIICVAPHTSNLDFILGKAAYSSVGRHAGFLMKSTWFFPPLGWIFRAMGGIPVHRGKHHGSPSLVQSIVDRFNTTPRLTIAITPEGTRSLTRQWHTGFLRIARQANVPIAIGIIDYGTRTIDVSQVFIPTGDIEADLLTIKQCYRGVTARHPDKFTID